MPCHYTEQELAYRRKVTAVYMGLPKLEKVPYLESIGVGRQTMLYWCKHFSAESPDKHVILTPDKEEAVMRRRDIRKGEYQRRLERQMEEEARRRKEEKEREKRLKEMQEELARAARHPYTIGDLTTQDKMRVVTIIVQDQLGFHEAERVSVRADWQYGAFSDAMVEGLREKVVAVLKGWGYSADKQELDNWIRTLWR